MAWMSLIVAAALAGPGEVEPGASAAPAESEPTESQSPQAPASRRRVPPEHAHLPDRRVYPTRQSVPRYPRNELEFGTFLEIYCRFSIRVEPDGVPSEALLVESPFCKEAYAAAAQKAALKSRYEPLDETVATFLVFKFIVSGFARLSGDGLKRIMDAHVEVPEDLPFCRMSFSVHPDGAVSGLRTSDRGRCLTMPTLAKPPPWLAPLTGGQSGECAWSFKVSKRGPRRLTLLEPCSKQHEHWSRHILETWKWNSPNTGASWPYRVTVRFSPAAGR